MGLFRNFSTSGGLNDSAVADELATTDHLFRAATTNIPDGGVSTSAATTASVTTSDLGATTGPAGATTGPAKATLSTASPLKGMRP